MKSGKRALLYLMRKRGRTILLLLFLFISASLLQIGGSLKSNADMEEEKLRQSLGTGFVLKSDLENELYYELRSEEGHDYNLYIGPRITEEMISHILKIDGVVDYDISFCDFVWTDLTLKKGAWADHPGPDEYFTKEKLELLKQKTRIYPCKKGERNKNFWTGAFTISEGRNIQEGDHYTAVISEWLAQENGLTVGDHFTVETKEGFFWGNKDPFRTLGIPIELEIVGLFHPNFQQEESDMTYEDGYVVNLIYTDLDTYATLGENAGEDINEKGYTEATFFVEDPAKLDFVMEQIRKDEKINIEGMIFKADDSAYKTSVRPFDQISWFSKTIMVIASVGIGVILYLLIRFWIRGRMHEAGIFLSIGIGKRKIIGQMLMENLIVSIVALLISFALSGSMVSQCVKGVERIFSPEMEREEYVVRLKSGSYPEVEKNTSEEIHLEAEIPENVRVFTVLIVCGISGLSVLLGSIQLLDIEPKKLLQSMN